LKLVGWEHFDISILEVCSSEEQGARENYYLQKYLPIFFWKKKILLFLQKWPNLLFIPV
jgi:hypothetical protein